MYYYDVFFKHANLSVYFQIFGYMSLCFGILSLVSIYCNVVYKIDESIPELMVNFLLLYIFLWSIIGIVLFTYIVKQHVCNDGIMSYLIIKTSFLIIFVIVYYVKKQMS